LVLLRLLLGAGESAVFPASSRLSSTYVPEEQRGSANGAISFGYLVGPAIGTFIGGLLMARFGWRPVFVLFGALSLVWLLPWLRFSRRLAAAPSVVSANDAPSYRELLAQKGLWGTSLGHFAGNYNWYFILSFMPLYLVDVRGFSLEGMAWVLSSAYVVNAVCAMASGWFTDRWSRSGRSASTIYKGSMVLSHAVSIGAMAGMMVLPVKGAVACLFVYEIFLGFCSPGTFAIGQTMAGPLATGRWIGIQNFCGNLAGILAPAVTGLLVAATGNYTLAFLLACAVNVLGILGWGVILPKVQLVRWGEPSQGS
jgi:MFS family permease